jgi:hypothetical protein
MKRAKCDVAHAALIVERKRRRAAIQDRWQAESDPPPDRDKDAFANMCKAFPAFAEAARKIGTLR